MRQLVQWLEQMRADRMGSANFIEFQHYFFWQPGQAQLHSHETFASVWSSETERETVNLMYRWIWNDIDTVYEWFQMVLPWANWGIRKPQFNTFSYKTIQRLNDVEADDSRERGQRMWSTIEPYRTTVEQRSPLRTLDTDSHWPSGCCGWRCWHSRSDNMGKGTSSFESGLADSLAESSQLIHADHCWFFPTVWQRSRCRSRILSMEPLEWAYLKSNMHTTSWHLLGTERIKHVSNQSWRAEVCNFPLANDRKMRCNTWMLNRVQWYWYIYSNRQDIDKSSFPVYNHEIKWWNAQIPEAADFHGWLQKGILCKSGSIRQGYERAADATDPRILEGWVGVWDPRCGSRNFLCFKKTKPIPSQMEHWCWIVKR